MPIYMKIDGVDGQVTAKGFEKWIELQSASLSVNRNVRMGASGGNREASTPNVNEIPVTKMQDTASVELFRLSLAGLGKKTTIAFTKTSPDGKENTKYMEVELEDMLVTNFTLHGHGGNGNDIPTESLNLNFTKITYTTTTSDSKNKVAGPAKAMWDLLKNTA